MKTRLLQFSNCWVRIMLGIIMLAHGLKKVKSMEDTLHHFQADIGLPAIVTYAVTAVEVLCGALLILGLFTRWAAAVVALVMIGAIVTVTWDKGFFNGYELNLALLAMAASLLHQNQRNAKEDQPR